MSGPLAADRPTQVLEDSNSEDQGMAWSPNGRWIVFHSHREMSDDVWLRPTDGSTPDRRITMLGRGAEVGWPRWSPDGTTVLLDGTAKDGRGVMFTIGVDQTTGQVTSEIREVVTAGFDEVTHGEWLPDSRRVVAIAKEGPGRHAVLLADTTGARPVAGAAPLRQSSTTSRASRWRPTARRSRSWRRPPTATSSCSAGRSRAGRWSS